MFRWGKYISLATALLNRIVCLAVAVFVLAVLADPDFFTRTDPAGSRSVPVDALLQYKTVAALAMVLWLALNLNIIQAILYSIWNTDTRRYITSKGPHGSTRVSLDAIERSLVAASREMGEVEKAKLSVYRIGGKRYKIEVRFWIPEYSNAQSVTEKLRLVLKKRFSELISLEPDERVFFEINLAGFKKGKRSLAFPPGGPPRDAVDPSHRQFKGPVYPIGGES